jgi:hypothetical protein
MMRAHQPGSQPLDIPEAIPNPAVPQPAPAPSPAPLEPVKVPAPQDAVAIEGIISGKLRSGCPLSRAAHSCEPADSILGLPRRVAHAETSLAPG